MNEIRIEGYIVADEDKELYDWFGLPSTSPKAIRDALKPGPTTVRINSYGGDVWSASVIYTLLKEHGEVTTQVDGLAASAASVILMAGAKAVMSPTAQLMIHNVATYAEGDYRDMDHAAKQLKDSNQTIINAYRLKTGLPEDEIQALLDEETWMSAQQAKEKGFIDEILYDEELVLDVKTVRSVQTAMRAAFAASRMPGADMLRKAHEARTPNPGTPEPEEDWQGAGKALLEIETLRH